MMSWSMEVKFGISSWSYPWAVGVRKGPRPEKRMSALDLVEQTYALGVRLLHITDNLPLENLPWETMIRLKRTSNQLGVRIEVGTRGADVDHLYKFLEIAQFLGSPIVSLIPVKTGKKVLLSEIEENLRSVLSEFEKAGVMITLVNQEAYKSLEYRKLMERINHPSLRMCLDLANALGAMEGPEYVMQELGPWCGSYHFRDVVIIRSGPLMGFTVEGRPSGQGQLSLPWALGELKKYDVEHNTIIELWPPWQGSIEETTELEKKWVAESIDYFNSLA